jgi:hypothetical protein
METEIEARVAHCHKKMEFLDGDCCKINIAHYFSQNRIEPYVITCSPQTEEFNKKVSLRNFKRTEKAYINIPKDVMVTTSAMIAMLKPALVLCGRKNKKIENHVMFDSKDIRTWQAWDNTFAKAREWYENNKNLTPHEQQQNLQIQIELDQKAVQALPVTKHPFVQVA